MIKRYIPALLVAASAAMVGCSSDNLAIPNPNQPTPGGILQDPRNGVQFLVNGVMTINRSNHDSWLGNVGSFGRESYNVFPTDGRSITGWYRDINVNTAFGASPAAFWANRYGNLKATAFIRDSVLPAAVFTDGERAATTGFTLTNDAIDIFAVILTENMNGAPTRIDPDPLKVTPFVSRDSVLSWVAGTLDAAYAQLTSAGAAFPFSFPGSGYAAFNTPAAYGQFNRAMKARVQAYRGSLATGAARSTLYASALLALQGTSSFLVEPVTAANRSAGPGYDYNTNAGENTNDFRVIPGAAGIYVHPSIRTEPEYATDPRITAYLTTVAGFQPASSSDTVTQKFNRFPGATQVIPVITNEELLLIRAEAKYLGGTDLAGGIADLVAVRAGWGLGAALVPNAAPANDAQFIDDLLHERRYSLLSMQQRWFDLRRFGRLSTMPVSGPTFRRTANQVLPQAECLGRIAPSAADATLACPTWVQTDPQNPSLIP